MLQWLSKIFGQNKVSASGAGQPAGVAPKKPSLFVFGPAADLDDSMRQTARSRFFAAKRLESRDRRITRLTAFCSAYIIALTAIPYFLKLPETVDDHINFLSLLMAVILLVSSLLQYSRLDIASAEQHHRSALEINELHREFVGRLGTCLDQNAVLHNRHGTEQHRRYRPLPH